MFEEDFDEPPSRINLTNGQCINQFMMTIAVYTVEVDGDDLLLTQLSQTKGRD